MDITIPLTIGVTIFVAFFGTTILAALLQGVIAPALDGGLVSTENSFGRLLSSCRVLRLSFWAVAEPHLLLFVAGENRFRTRLGLLVSIGPLTSLAILVAALLVTPLVRDNSDWRSPLSIAAVSTTATEVVVLAFYLFPWSVTSPAGAVLSTGKALLTIARMSPDERRTAIEHHGAVRRLIVDARSSWRDLDAMQRQLAEVPDSDPTRNARQLLIAHAFDGRGDSQEAFDRVGSMIDETDETDPLFPELLNARAWYGLMTQRDDLLDEAEANSEWAMELCDEPPPHFKGTLGSILIAKGQLEPGRVLLRQAFRGNARPSKALNACYFALAAILEGDPESANRHLDTARKLDPECRLLPIFEAKLTELAA